MGYSLGQINPKLMVQQIYQAKQSAYQIAANQYTQLAAKATTPAEKEKYLKMAQEVSEKAQQAAAQAAAIKPPKATETYAPPPGGFMDIIKKPLVIGGLTVGGLALIWLLFLRKRKGAK